MLFRMFRRNRTGNDVAATIGAVHIHAEIGTCFLYAVRINLFAYGQFRFFAERGTRYAVRIVYALNLRHLHIHACAVCDKSNRFGVHHTFPLAVALAVMPFYIPYF